MNIGNKSEGQIMYVFLFSTEWVENQTCYFECENATIILSKNCSLKSSWAISTCEQKFVRIGFDIHAETRERWHLPKYIFSLSRSFSQRGRFPKGVCKFDRRLTLQSLFRRAVSIKKCGFSEKPWTLYHCAAYRATRHPLSPNRYAIGNLCSIWISVRKSAIACWRFG